LSLDEAMIGALPSPLLYALEGFRGGFLWKMDICVSECLRDSPFLTIYIQFTRFSIEN
jgi:hypothetical protein